MPTFSETLEQMVHQEVAEAVSSRDAARLAKALDMLIRSAAILCVCSVGNSSEGLSDLLDGSAQYLFEEASRIQAAVETMEREGGAK